MPKRSLNDALVALTDKVTEVIELQGLAAAMEPADSHLARLPEDVQGALLRIVQVIADTTTAEKLAVQSRMATLALCEYEGEDLEPLPRLLGAVSGLLIRIIEAPAAESSAS